MVSTLEYDDRIPMFKPWRDTTKFLYFFSPVLIFFLSISFYFLIFTEKNTKTTDKYIVYCEALGVKCLELFFEPSPNELTELLIGSIILTRIKFEGNRHIYEYNYYSCI